ncbi:hypothetical protein SNE04_02480, partial [Escherichia coli]|nr:hypothetical protein [Escherichia coli]
MELVNTLFASLVGTDPFTGVDITIANCKSAYWDEGIVQQLINQALDEGEKFVGADGLEGLLRYNVTLNIGLTSSNVWPGFSLDTATIREGANKRGNSSRLTQSFHFFMFEP